MQFWISASLIGTRNSHWSDGIIYIFPQSSISCQLLKHYACIKNTSIDQISLDHLISKHEMFSFEKTAFKTFKFLLEYLIFRKIVQTVRFKFCLKESCKQHHVRINIPYLEERKFRGRYSIQNCMSFHFESMLAGY
jgi:hypothetical protein